MTAEDIAKRVSGVRAIANELQVKIPLSGVRSDTDIAEAAANAMQWHLKSLLQAGKIKEVTITEDQLTGIAEISGITDAVRAKDAKPASAVQAPTAAGPDDYKFVVARVPDANLVAELQAAKVKFAGRIENRWFWTVLSWIAPAVDCTRAAGRPLTPKHEHGSRIIECRFGSRAAGPAGIGPALVLESRRR